MASQRQQASEWRAGLRSRKPESPPVEGACARCGHVSEGELECPRCGVVFAKVTARRATLSLPLEMREVVPDEPSDWRKTAVVGLGLVAVVWLGTPLYLPPVPLPRGPVRVALPTNIPRLPAQPPDTLPRDEPSLDPSPEPQESLLASGDIPVPELSGFPASRAGSRPPTAPGPMATPDPNLVNLRRRLAANDWSGAEESAIAILKTIPRLPEALCGLGQALFRQDRAREAVEAIKECAEFSSTPGERQTAQVLLRSVEGSFASEKGLEELKSEHFKVRFDGEAHESIGRDVLSSLERQYSTVANALDHRPKGVIPVVLFTGARYVSATGSGDSLGLYSNHDGRIRINMAGLASGVTNELEKTLIHEMTHAFAGDLGGSVVPRDVHEGLAQYLEGERVGNRLSASQIATLKGGGRGDTWDFYQAALSFVEHLLSIRGMSGMRELLRIMGEKRDVNRAFDDVYGRSYSELRKAWLGQLRES